jgi:electron transfer flavoprotein beta subunit
VPELSVVVALKWAPLRVEVDELTGVSRPVPRSEGLAACEQAALEVGLRLAAEWGCPLLAATAGPAAADGALREAAAVGVTDVVRVHVAGGSPSGAVAVALASACPEGALVVCGDASADRGSAAVPAFLAAMLGTPMALGLVDVAGAGPGRLAVQRRLDRGGREVLDVTAPAVVSVEGSVARLRRGGLDAALAAPAAPVRVLAPSGSVPPVAPAGPPRPHRPRTKVVPPPPPGEIPLERIRRLSGATTERTPPRLLHLDPPDAAAAIVEQLRRWGYLA